MAFIPFLVLGEDFKPQLKVLQEIPDWTTQKLLNDKKLFLTLIQFGAQYKHYLAYAYTAVSLKGLARLLHLYGQEATCFPAETGSFILNTMTTYFDEYAFKKIALLLQYGANINERIDREYENTVIHHLIAQEEAPYSSALNLINFCENLPQNILNANPNCQIGYHLQDKYGKTPLLLAVGLNLTAVVDKLLELANKKNKDIGINIPNHEGQTPLMIASALGHKEIFEKLLLNGANLYSKDNEGRDVAWYMHANENVVRNILTAFSIHSDRSIYSLKSYLYVVHNGGEVVPLVLLDKNGDETTIIMSRKSPFKKQLEIAMMFIENDSINPDFIINKEYLMNQTKFLNPLLKDDSVLDQKLSDQIKIREYINQQLFFLACAFGDLEKVKYFIEIQKVDIDSLDHCTRNGLHFAVMRKELVEKLLNIHKPDYLIEDCLKSHLQVFQYLIMQGANIDQKNSANNSPMELLIRESFKNDEHAKTMLAWIKEFRDLPKNEERNISYRS